MPLWHRSGIISSVEGIWLDIPLNAIAFNIAQLLCYCEKDNLCSLLDSGRKIFYWSKLTMLRSTSPAVSSGEERGLISRTAAGNRAYSWPRHLDLSAAWDSRTLLWDTLMPRKFKLGLHSSVPSIWKICLDVSHNAIKICIGNVRRIEILNSRSRLLMVLPLTPRASAISGHVNSYSAKYLSWSLLISNLVEHKTAAGTPANCVLCLPKLM